MNSIAVHVTDIVGNRFASPARSPGSGVAEGADTPSPALPRDTFKNTVRREELSKVVDKVNQNVQQVMREIKFSMDENSNRVVIKVIDQRTKEVIREIPPEEFLNVAEQLNQFTGILLKEKA